MDVATLLEIFWQTHDPTTLNRQGADTGTQYRSAVFFHTPEQQKEAEAWKQKLNAQHVFPNPIVTEITPASAFYVAEDYHQNYYNENGTEPYCQIVIKPKMDKFLKAFKYVWIYALLPFAGAILAVIFHEFVFKKTQEVMAEDDLGSDENDNLLEK